MITKENAIEICKRDASCAYSDLSDYEIKVTQENENWRVDFNLKEPYSVGGGPHYVLSVLTGEIIYRRFDQ